MNPRQFDLIVIGAGVLGSFHAYHACRKGLKVLLVEKDRQPMEATVRNFGQIVPSGMSTTKWQQYGRKSLDIYNSLQQKFDLTVQKQGSIYIASDDTETALITELAAINKDHSYDSVLLTAADCIARYPGLKAEYCRAGLYFPEEITVEPGKMIHRLIAYMQEQLKLTYKHSTAIISCERINENCVAKDSSGECYTSDKIIICNGRDFRCLFPEIFKASNIRVSKLQMMRTVPLVNYRLSGSVLSGLSIRRYESFRECPSYPSFDIGNIPDPVKKWGIHILFKQGADGSMIIGDSHEYASAAEQDKLGFETRHEINELILAEAKKIFNLPSWTIAATWNGYYAESETDDLFNHEIAPGIHIVTAIGGKGMTASAGLAEEIIDNIFTKENG